MHGCIFESVKLEGSRVEDLVYLTQWGFANGAV